MNIFRRYLCLVYGHRYVEIDREIMRFKVLHRFVCFRCNEHIFKDDSGFEFDVNQYIFFEDREERENL